MAEKSIKKNFIYSLLNKVVAVLIPILITPYLARVLEPDGNGVLSFVSSFASYFIIFANVGIETYGQREIAIHRNDKEFLKKFLIEITLFRGILTAVSLAVYYAVFVFNTGMQNNLLYAIYGITILCTAFDFTWFFQGLEEFGLLAISSIIVRVSYVILTFLLVKTKQDIAIAAFLAVVMTSMPTVLCSPFVARYMRVKLTEKIKPFSHFKPCMVYFIPTIAIQIYTILDKTMIGLITGSDFENGYYEQADKLIKLPLTVIMTFNIIVRSRISYYFSINREDKIKELTLKSLNVSCLLTIPMAFGMAAVAKTLVPVYLGEGYESCINLIYVLSPIIIIIGLSNLIGTHYYTPYGKQSQSNKFLIGGAVVNLALNSFLIFLFKSMGAAIASVLAEMYVAVTYVIFAKSFLPFKTVVKTSVKYFIAAIAMFVPVFIINLNWEANILNLLVETCIGIAVYAVMLIILRVDFIKDVFAYLKGKFIKKDKKDEL